MRTRPAATNGGLRAGLRRRIQPENTVAALREAEGLTIDVVPPNVTTSATQPGAGEGAHLDQRGILGGVPAVLTLADLPREKRLRVQGFVADLHSKLDERGLMTTVPGELLFTVGSDEVQADAYAKLVKLAELIRLYDSPQVLIIGHSDADGDATYSKELSQRRAELVKQILVENFDLAARPAVHRGRGRDAPDRLQCHATRAARQPPRGGPDPELIPRRSTRAPAFLRTGSASGSIPRIVPRASAPSR